MGSKPNWDQLFAQLQSQIAQATAPSPYEQQMSQQWANTNNWLNAKDYRNTPNGVNVDLLPVAEYQKMRQMTRGRGGDTAAAGVMNNNILNQQRELGDNQFLQDWGSSYENEIGNLKNQNMNLGGALQNQYVNRMNTGIQGAGMALQSFANKPKSFWSTLLPNLIGGAAKIGSAFI